MGIVIEVELTNELIQRIYRVYGYLDYERRKRGEVFRKTPSYRDKRIAEMDEAINLIRELTRVKPQFIEQESLL